MKQTRMTSTEEEKESKRKAKNYIIRYYKRKEQSGWAYKNVAFKSSLRHPIRDALAGVVYTGNPLWYH